MGHDVAAGAALEQVHLDRGVGRLEGGIERAPFHGLAERGRVGEAVAKMAEHVEHIVVAIGAGK